jgi:hypothetical protein
VHAWRGSALVFANLFLVGCSGTYQSVGGTGDSGTQDAPIAPFAGGPMDIPLAVSPISVTLPDGGGQVPAGYRLTLKFALGDAGPLEGILDTGSEGIQLLESSLPPDSRAAISQLGSTEFAQTFQMGVQAIGVLAKATVTLGDRTTTSPILITVYRSFSCEDGGACSQTGGAPVGSDLFEGYPALVGVGLRATAIAGFGSPIPQLAGQPSSYIVEAPSFGGDAGILRIDPSADEVANYAATQLPRQIGGAPLPNGTPAWNDAAMPSCISDRTTAKDYCANAILDTGAPLTAIFWTGQSTIDAFPSGSDLAVSIGPTSSPVGQFNVVVGAVPQLGYDAFALAPPVPGTGNQINLGLTVFFRYSVYFNHSSGRIGLFPH